MEREILCVVTPDKAGKRLDAYLASAVEDLSRNYAENLIGEERVHVNDGIEAKKYKVREGDRIRIDMPAPRPIDVEPQNSGERHHVPLRGFPVFHQRGHPPRHRAPHR